MNFWDQFPGVEDIGRAAESETDICKVNGHVHTPYSFSAYSSVEHAVLMAKNEDVKVLGINDFFSTEGYAEMVENCKKHKVFPLFNIEFIGLSKHDQQLGVRINDPSNPGRIYISGKGMSHPFRLDDNYINLLTLLQEKSNNLSEAMCAVLNKHLTHTGVDIQLSYPAIMENLTKGLVRERHIAKALRIAVFEKEAIASARIEIFKTIFSGKKLKSDIENIAALENEIRGNLLKAGGPAFIEESPDQFPDLETLRLLILNGGGIPTYPLLSDSVNGTYTEFEADKEKLCLDLHSKGIFSIEFVPNRNSTKSLEEYAKFFTDKGFVITFGSEHNTPELIPITLTNNSGEALSDFLKEVNFSGACILAAHQYLKAKTGEGYLDAKGKPWPGAKAEFEKLGRQVLSFYYNN